MAIPQIRVNTTYDGTLGIATIMFRIFPPTGPEVASLEYRDSTERVTGPARGALDISAANMVENISALHRWTDQIATLWEPQWTPPTAYRICVERPATGPFRIEQDCSVGAASKKIDLKATWRKSDNVVHLSSRRDIDLSWSETLIYLRCWEQFQHAIRHLV